jgi:hypothetical protein
MTTQQFLKGLLMALVGVVVVAFSSSPIDIPVMAVTLIGTFFVYVGKNAIAVLQSTSPAGSLNWVNILSGLFVAIGSAVIQGLALLVLDGKIDWLVLGKVVLSVTFTYLGSTLFAPAAGGAK